ncbi:MAG: DUF1845 family protein [Candidatus Competibacteraceae bacterium]|nr:DUF1845 family protein [Candidatus Competibacteraceae bacterium]
MATLTPPKSLPVIRRELTLHSMTSIKTYQRTYERMEWMLYLADVLVRVRGDASRRFDQETDQVIVAVESCLDQAQMAFRDTQRFYENRLRNAHIDLHGNALAYSHPLTLVLQTRTPLGQRYIELLEKLDTVAQRIDLAWYHGLIKARQQLDGNQKLYYWLLRTTRRVSILARGLAHRVQQADAVAPGIDANYATLLASRVGIAPNDETPLDVASETMTVDEHAEIEESKQLIAALSVSVETAPDAPVTAGESAEPECTEVETTAAEVDADSSTVEDVPETAAVSRGFARLSRTLTGH